MWKFIVGGLFPLFGIGGVAYGRDQHAKRRREQAEYRHEIARLEAQLRDLEARHGRHSEQFRAMAAQLARARRDAA